MKIKNITQFRQYIKKKVGRENDKLTDENFVGTYFENNGELVKGFFEIYHGNKPDIAKYLRATAVNIAADEQAIYEFMQNAVDCGSSHFFIFYNDDYFLAINNGTQFQTDEIEAVLNLGQSEKGNAEIGSYGIGFKIVHRLVGQNDGVDELTKEYKGPILFSWSNLNDFKTLLKNQDLEHINANSKSYDNAPWLFKILLTNFPTEPNELVKDQSYTNEKVLFPQTELKQLIDFVNLNLKKHKNNFKYNILNQGSLFFLKLGAGKKKYLDENKKELERGVGYSLNTLKNLQKVYINEKAIGKHTLQLMNNLVIQKDTDEFKEIAPENTERDINIIFGYYADYEKSKEIINAPNFYNFFPMESEVNEFRFIIHCNAFDNRANRRELHKSEINERLLFHIIKKIINQLNEYKKKGKDRDKFLQIYLSFLLSKIPQEDTKWLLEPFFNHILKYLRNNIPTLKSYKNKSENVVIKSTALNISPEEFGIQEKEWFYFNDSIIKIEARDEKKLGLKSWTIIDLLYFGNIQSINKWIENNSQLIGRVLKEINSEWHSRSEHNDFADKFKQIKLFKFVGVKELQSLTEIASDDKYLFIFDKINNIISELQEIGFKTSEINISDFSKNRTNIFETSIRGFVKLNNFDTLFERINKYCSLKPLSNISQKNNLFKILTSDPKEFIDSKHFPNIQIYQNKKGDILPINELITDNELIKENNWLNQYEIEEIKDLNISALITPISCNVEDLYSKIIYPNWLEIIAQDIFNNENIISFYNTISKDFYRNDLPVLSLKPFVWTGDNFVEKDKIFYHSSLNKLSYEEYENFDNLINKWFELRLPNIQIAEFLEQQPFKTDSINSLPINTIPKESFTKEEFSIFLSWNKEIGAKLFKDYFIVKNENEFELRIKEEKVKQYYTDNKQISDYLASYAEYKLLPSCFAEYITDEIISNSTLHEKLIQICDFDNLDKDIIEIFNSLGELEKGNFIKNLNFSYFKIDAETFPVKDSIIYCLLDFACGLNNAENQKEIRKKIKIGDFQLDENSIPENTLLLENIEINISELLQTNVSEKSKIIKQAIDHFVSIGLNKEKLKQIFGLSGTTHTTEIHNQFLEILNINDNICQNSNQLVYCILKGIKTAKEKMQDESNYGVFEYKHYCSNTSLKYGIKSSVLANIYVGLSELLKLNDNNPYYQINDSVGIIYEPYFEKNVYICPDIDLTEPETENIDKEKRLVFINDLYAKYKLIKDKYSNIEIDNEEFINWFEFTPNLSVFPNKFATDDEKLPDWIINWFDNDSEKVKFISALNVHTENSPINSIVFFRKNLNTNFSDLYKKSEYIHFLKNTLLWIFENDKDINTDQAKRIKSIFEFISPTFELPFVTIKDCNTLFYELHNVITDDYYINEEKQNELSKLNIDKCIILDIIKKYKTDETELDLVPALSDFYSQNYISFIENNLTKIIISEPKPNEKRILDNNNYSEWFVDFYTDIKSDLDYEIYLHNGDIPIIWTFLSEPVKTDFSTDIAIGDDKIYINKNNFSTPSQILDLINSQSELFDIHKKLYDKKNEAALKIGETLIERGISEIDINFDKIESSKNEEDLKTNIQNSIHYSFKWYNSFLEILHYYSASTSSSERSIKFERVIIDKNIEKLLHLENSNNFIPYFIENADKITLIIQTIDEDIEVKLRGLSVKTNHVEVLLHEPLNINQKDIKNAILKVSNTIDLLREIKNAFKNLNYQDNYSMRDNLPKNIEFIFGPPGTGKTTTLAKQITNLIIDDNSNKIIVLLPTNKAADVLTEKIIAYCIENKIDYSWLIRFGSTLSELIVEEEIQKTPSDDLSQYSKMVFITTIARFPYDKYLIYKNGEEYRFPLKNTIWNYVVFDEASMIAQYYIVHAIYKSFQVNENCKYIVSGDPFQIPPVVTIPEIPENIDILEQIKEENVYSLIQLETFNSLNQDTVPHNFKINNLDTQYRSLIPIGELFSQFRYEGLIKHNKKYKPTKSINLEIGKKQLNLINTIRFKVNSDDGIYRPGRINYSGFQPYSAILVAEFINKLAQSLEGNWNIGIVSLYKAQSKLISNLISAYEIYKINPEINILSDTVHGFQGDEYDIVFCVFSPSSYSISSKDHHLGKKNFLHKKNILNVAISRAKDYLFILIPDDSTEQISNFVYWNEMKQILSSDKIKDYYQNFSDEEIEKFIFNDKKHIERNSFRTEHQTVNIYSKPFTKYFVTSDDNAIDIQINNLEIEQ